MSQQEDLSNLRSLVGGENILAECTGVNYTVYVTDSRLLVGKRFSIGEKIVNVRHAEVSTLELITKSLIPPLTYAVLGAIAVFLVWWFPGQARLSLPQAPFDLLLIGTLAVFLAAVLATWWRRRVAVLRIGISGTKDPITVRLVPASKAESVFKALKG
ncbi:hypothetical protein E6H34_09285 [Candidatus Bathyarchaeota archaeon]|nr:MAG: hypothetical protein E6H34_09285 [Candidatus Bathyarchaeota archaeon]